MSNPIIVETRRSKGVFKADLTQFSKDQIKTVLDHFSANSYVAVKNYRSKADDNVVIEIKFHKLGTKGTMKYSLKTILNWEDLKSIGFVETPNKNMHLTAPGNSIDAVFDVEVKEPTKKISSKKKSEEKAEKSVKKTPVAHPSKTKITEKTTEEPVAEKTTEEPVAETKTTTKAGKTPLLAAAK